jgi:glycosyltransferase involved in cell wall biosynthesis
MKLLIELTYYRPHTSGLTIYAERLARAFVDRGNSVTILTSQYDRRLSTNESVNGIKIVRIPVVLRISKGVVMPSFGVVAQKLIMEHDALSLHLPQVDAAGLAFRGRIYRKPTIITYHCDLQMPPGAIPWLANQSVNLINNLAAFFTHRIVAYTQDYADHSSYLRKFSHKMRIIPPPVELPSVSQNQILSFYQANNSTQRYPIIGIAARFASEKGIEVLLRSLDSIIKKYPNIVVWFAGPYQNILGEEKYLHRLSPLIAKYKNSGHWKFLGLLNPEQMAAFYPNLDVLVLPSLNSTESFGLVQIEAMMNGIPVIASNLPGVRQPVITHNFGKIIPVGDSNALITAVVDLLENPIKGKINSTELKERYSPDLIATKYEKLIDEIKGSIE